MMPSITITYYYYINYCYSERIRSQPSELYGMATIYFSDEKKIKLYVADGMHSFWKNNKIRNFSDFY